MCVDRFWYSAACDSGITDSDCTAISQTSNATVTWDIPPLQTTGTYRLVHYGNARRTAISVVSYTGTSSEFQVVMPSDWKNY